jgi:hypothetical protein
MQKLIDQHTIPPDGMRYFQPETRMTIRGGDYWDLFVQVEKHRKVNNIPLGPLWKEEVEDQLCKTLPPGFCKEIEPGKRSIGVTTRVGWEDLERGMAVMIDWASQGRPHVSQELAEKRARICIGCYYNVNLASGCHACQGVVNMIYRAVGGSRTSLDAMLKQCAVCKCSNQAQVHFPVEVLAEGTPDEMIPLFPEFCWKKEELIELKKGEVVHGG